jgi:hypothetical protein
MHDANLDDRLRSVLRGEGDALPFTITTDELDRRLVLRRRARSAQRMRLVAAGVAAVAVGAIFTLGSGMLQGTDVATDPSPSPTASGPAADPLAALVLPPHDPQAVSYVESDRPVTVSDPDPSLAPYAVDGVILEARQALISVSCLGPDARLEFGTRADPTAIAVETVACDTRPRTFRYDIAARQPMEDQSIVLHATRATSFRIRVESIGGPTPSPTPREATPLGAATEAILVSPIGDATRPDAFAVTAYDVVSGVTRPIAEVPGTTLPETARIEYGNPPPRVSESGFLAIPFTLGPTEDEARRAVAIVDLRAPDAPAFVVDHQDAIAWDPADKLVMERDGVITIAWPMSRFLEPFGPLGVGVSVLNVNAIGGGPAIATTEGARFLALSGDADGNRWGYLDFQGAFVATDDLPGTYQRTGVARPTGAGGHTLGMGCDSGGPNAGEYAGCFLVEGDGRGEPIRTWLNVDERILHDHAWAADGRSTWLLVDRSPDVEGSSVALVHATSPDDWESRASFPMFGGRPPRILGIAGEATPGDALGFIIGDDDGLVRAFLDADGAVTRSEGTAWFAGWAGQQPAYDPD